MFYPKSAGNLKPVLCLLLMLLAGGLFAQDGRWVEYDLSTIGVNLGLGARDDGLIAYAPLFSQYFLVFDVNVGEWLTIDLGEEQDFESIATKGHLACVYSATLLAAYSDKTQTWDTVYYSGTLLDNADGFGLSEHLGYFLTDQYLYVFDSETGEFYSYAYTIPADFITSNSWAQSDFICVVLFRDDSNPPVILVYSAHTKSFNQLDQGIPPIIPYMDHGFSRVTDYDGGVKMIGYSAYDNQFDVIYHDFIEGEYLVGGGGGAVDFPDENTANSFVFRHAESFEYSEAHHYSYDSRHGEWVHQYYYYPYDEITYYGTVGIGGNYASDFGEYKSEDSRPAFFIFFDGTNNDYRVVNPGMDFDMPDIAYRHGGNFYAFFDSTRIWAYVPEENSGNIFAWGVGEYAQMYAGWDFFTATRYVYQAETMRTYFYNSRTKTWQSIELPNHWNREGIATPQFYLHCASPENEAVFYSSPQDVILYHNLPDESYPTSRVRGHMAYAAVDAQTVLFDGKNGEMIYFDFDVYNDSRNGLGKGSAILCDDAGNSLYGYSSILGLQSSITLTEDPYFCYDSGYVGIMTVWYNNGSTNNGYNKIYAYNSLANSWVPLIPTGNHNAVMVGQKTALVARSSGGGSPAKLYAFDPQRQVTAVEDEEFTDDGILPEKFTLSQNYPNPFNPSTVVEYSLPRREKITIEIFDILGRKVRTILEQEMAAGKYRTVWNGRDDRGGEVATGVYFCRLTAGSESLSKKMVLLK